MKTLGFYPSFSNSHHMPVRLKDSPKTQRSRLLHAEWLGNTSTLIIVSENDIYLRQSPANEEDIRLTHSGVAGLIYNGVTDWLYQGNIIAFNAAAGHSLSLLSFLLILILSFPNANRGNFQIPKSDVVIDGWFNSLICHI